MADTEITKIKINDKERYLNLDSDRDVSVNSLTVEGRNDDNTNFVCEIAKTDDKPIISLIEQSLNGGGTRYTNTISADAITMWAAGAPQDEIFSVITDEGGDTGFLTFCGQAMFYGWDTVDDANIVKINGDDDTAIEYTVGKTGKVGFSVSRDTLTDRGRLNVDEAIVANAFNYSGLAEISDGSSKSARLWLSDKDFPGVPLYSTDLLWQISSASNKCLFIKGDVDAGAITASGEFNNTGIQELSTDDAAHPMYMASENTSSSDTSKMGGLRYSSDITWNPTYGRLLLKKPVLKGTGSAMLASSAPSTGKYLYINGDNKYYLYYSATGEFGISNAASPYTSFTVSNAHDVSATSFPSRAASNATAFKTTDGNFVTTNGQMTAQSFNATSDRRLKENIVDYICEKSILDLPVKKFDFIEGSRNQIGCIAQDLQEICPEIVHEGDDGYLSIQESKIVYLLLDEVKRLRKEVDELKGGK